MQNIVSDVIDRLEPEYRLVFLCGFEEFQHKRRGRARYLRTRSQITIVKGKAQTEEKLSRHFRQGAPN